MDVGQINPPWELWDTAMESFDSVWNAGESSGHWNAKGFEVL